MLHDIGTTGAGQDERSTAAPSMRWALASLSLAMLMPSLATSIANVGLPTLAQAFEAPFDQVQWILLAYLLAITGLIVGVGRLGDIIGRRRLLVVGIGIFTVASVLCGLAPTLWLLVAARAVQGLGAAIIMAFAMAMVGETVPRARIGSAMGLLGTMSAIGTTLGPSLGGLLIVAFDWRMIFLINAPLGILNIVLALWALPADRPATDSGRNGFDILGTLLLALTLAAFALSMTTARGGFGPVNPVLLSIAVLGGIGFVFAQAVGKSPLIRVALLRDRTISAGLVMSVLVSTVMMATLVVGPFYLSRGLGLDAARLGLAMSVGPLMAALAGVPAGRMVDRFGARRMALAGLVGMATGLIALCVAPSGWGAAGFMGPIVMVTIHYALFQAANNTAVMADIQPDQRGVVSGMLNLSRNLGLIAGASAMGAVFAFAAATTDMTTASPRAVAEGMRTTFIVAAVLIGLAVAILPPARRAKAAGRP